MKLSSIKMEAVRFYVHHSDHNDVNRLLTCCCVFLRKY